MSGLRPTTRTLSAHAKVNLFLRVLGRRSDGYHDLETLIVPISLADRLEVHADAGPSFRTLSLSLEVTGAPELVRDVPQNETNLVLRAAGALAERAGVRGFAEVALEKLVPSGAGLGGGSADAAATLTVLNELWGCGLSVEELGDLGASVGSDVPALLAGSPVLASGRGERVEPARCGPLSLALVTFGFAVATPEAFGWWDQDGSTGPDPKRLLAAAATGDPRHVAGGLFNDLEGPVARRHPEVAQAERILMEGGAVGALMSGSGPSVLGLLPDATSRIGSDAEQQLERLTGRTVGYVQTRGAAGPP
jgi:4-diphosphocytidyl-2-C-methyl-D-erythritol kinase